MTCDVIGDLKVNKNVSLDNFGMAIKYTVWAFRDVGGGLCIRVVRQCGDLAGSGDALHDASRGPRPPNTCCADAHVWQTFKSVSSATYREDTSQLRDGGSAAANCGAKSRWATVSDIQFEANIPKFARLIRFPGGDFRRIIVSARNGLKLKQYLWPKKYQKQTWEHFHFLAP